MAKRQSVVWKHFKKIRINDRLYGQCKYCKKQYQTHAGRMRRHLGICQTCPFEIKHLFFEDNPVNNKYAASSQMAPQRVPHSPNIELPSDQGLHQSQPLSPTKLKVTRQAMLGPVKPPQPSPKPPTPEPANEEVCLRWNSHHSNMQTSFPAFLNREQYVDVTLVAEGRTLKCHRLILCSCSPYFEDVLNGISPMQHPVLFLKDIPFWIVKSLCDFMYSGEVHIFQNRLEELLSVAEALKIKGLAGKTNDSEDSKNKKDPEKQMKTPIKSNPIPKRVDTDSDDVLDPLDLLEPVYEELTKDNKPSTSNMKAKESLKLAQIKRHLPKRVKRRRYSDESEETPQVFQSRKGTRSRPNVKVPKFYHSSYSSSSKSPDNSPSIDHKNESFMDPSDIKSEPYDPEDDAIDVEDNAVSFTDEEMGDDEDIYLPNPIVTYREPEVRAKSFKKISLVAQPIIMSEKSNLEIIDMSKNGGKVFERKSAAKLDPMDSGLEIIDTTNNKVVSDPLKIAAIQSREESPSITISDVRTVERKKSEKRSERVEDSVDVSKTDEAKKSSGKHVEIEKEKNESTENNVEQRNEKNGDS